MPLPIAILVIAAAIALAVFVVVPALKHQSDRQIQTTECVSDPNCTVH